jgi:hypothetical protein
LAYIRAIKIVALFLPRSRDEVTVMSDFLDNNAAIALLKNWPLACGAGWHARLRGALSLMVSP